MDIVVPRIRPPSAVDRWIRRPPMPADESGNADRAHEVARHPQSAHIDPAYSLALKAFKDLFDMLDPAFFDGMPIVVDQLDDRFVTNLLWRSDERGRRSARLVVSQFLHRCTLYEIRKL